MGHFVHLHLHTTYSLLDGQCQIVPLVKRARKLGMPALAVTDHGNLYALKSFYDECRSNKDKVYGELAGVHVKPILGCEAYVTSTGDYTTRDKSERRFHLCLHAKNLTGYHNLVKLISKAHIGGFYHNARIDHSLLEQYHEGLHCSSACIAGEVSNAIRNGRMEEAERIAAWYKELFGDDYSLEVMLHKSQKHGENIPLVAQNEFAELYRDQVKVVSGMLALGRKLGIRVIATNDVHFLDAEDDDSHDVLLALSTGKKLSDENRLIYTGQEYLKTEEEMRALFAEHPELIDNTLEVAERIEEYNLDSDPIMPKFEIPAAFGSEDDMRAKYDEETLTGMYPEGRIKKLGGYEKVIRIQFEAEYLASLVWKGAKGRWGENIPQEIADRVQFELDTIRTMGFPGYFLIVHDYIRAAREVCGVWVGPGRGSAAGSAVAYALGITNVDPIKYDLLFERFLNPDRISMPDIDVDFDDAGRERVLDYVTRKYGADHVAHIVTFGQMAAKSAIKDVGRVMGYDLGLTNKLAGLVPDTPKINFKKARDVSPDLEAAFHSDDPVVHKLMERAGRLEGCIRQPGVHACGVIISRDPLIETLPVMPTPEKGGKAKGDSEAQADKLLTTQYDGHFVEPVGLLKMDFLGLKTLTVEKECVLLLGANNPRVPEAIRDAAGRLDPDKIPDDDRETYALFGRGETTGLFQFESPGMKKWLIALQPERLSDLVAMNALYRPGPMDYIPTFVARKQGREPVVYDHPLMEKYLKDTYGVTVYQEQVMLQSRLLAGFTRGESDKLRKAMGKKQMDIMAELKEKFVKGCLENPSFRVDRWQEEKEARELIEKIWKDWEAFASYAFNKSHAVCYAWVAYQTGYMKAHYPAEFMCAQISSEIGNFDKLPGFVAEARDIGLELLLPDVNESGARFVPAKGSKGIRYGLGGIKGVGSAAAEAIVAERTAKGPYKGFLDFGMRLAGNNLINKRVLENLAKTGAFSTLLPNRATLLRNVEYVLKKAQQRAKERYSAQTSFFDVFDAACEQTSDAELLECPPFAPAEDLKNERELLGVYISGDPLKVCRHAIGELSRMKVGDELLPFTLDKIARKPAPEDDEPLPESTPETDVSSVVEEIDDTPERAVEEENIQALLNKEAPQPWMLKSLANRIVFAKGEVSRFDKVAFDKAVAKEAAQLKKRIDTRLLKRIEVRAIGILDACTVKMSKPRADGQSSKWAILALDDGFGRVEAPAFAKVWERSAALETKVDSLVMVTGEVAYKPVYDKDDVQRAHPQVGELGFTLKEALPLGEALSKLSKGLRISMSYTDPDIKDKVNRIRSAIQRNVGTLPVVIELHYPSGKVLDVDLGSEYRVEISLAFLSELYKIIPQQSTTFKPEDRMVIQPRSSFGAGSRG